MRPTTKYFLGLILWCLSSLALAGVSVSGRHVYILYPGLDAVWGSYLFLVKNDGTAPERFRFPVMLPKETIDFQAQDSLAPDELKLGEDGGLTIDKEFAVGESLINIGFKMPAQEGEASIQLREVQAFETLAFFVFEGKFRVEGAPFEVKQNVDFSGRRYDTYTLTKGEGAASLNFVAKGLPEGRERLKIIAYILAGILGIGALSFAYKSRPKLPEGAEEIV